MADLKITDLGAALSVGDSNVTVLDDGTSTMKVTMNQLKEYSIGTTDISGIGNGTPTGAISSVNTSKNNVRDSIAPTETSTASRAYEVDEKMYISDVLYKATRAIALGDPLVSGTNITPANDVSAEILELKSDASEAIDSVKNIIAPVEDGGTAVLSYSAGDQFIHLGALCKAKTTINAGDTFIINTNYVDAGQVVDQLDSVKQALSDEVSARATLGAHNLAKALNSISNWYGVTISTDTNGISTISGTSTIDGGRTFLRGNNFLLPKGSYIWSSSSDLAIDMCLQKASDSSVILLKSSTSADASFTLSEDTYVYVGINVIAMTYNNVSLSFMIRCATDTDTTYQPYAMTNQQLTNEVVTQTQALANEILYFTSVACAATTGNFATITDDNITADHVLVDCVFANSAAIETDVTWTSSDGSFVLNGTCSTATTATITLAKKGN